MHRNVKFPALAAAMALTLSLLAGCSNGDTLPTVIQEGDGPSAAPVQTAQPSDPAAPEPTPDATVEPTPQFPLYEFGTPLEESEPVADDSFFDNAVFLGDSRTEGLQLYSGLTHGTFYWARGMSVFRADDPEYAVFNVDGQACTLVGTLSKKQYDKVYIMIGINELGYPAESYDKGMAELVDKVIAAQPNAVIYLQTLPPVNDAVAQENGLAYYINNENVNRFNEGIIRVAQEKKVVLLDTASIYRGADGQLPAELASDGAHFVPSGYAMWVDYLRTHVMDSERYFYNRSLEE